MTVLAYVAASFYQGVYYSLMKTAVLVNDYKSVFDL